jgi:hypothetical protein
MDHLPQDHDKSSAPRKHLPLNEKGVVGEVAVLIPPDVDSDEFLITQAYRLYKRRWIGVFAMVSTPFPATYCS